jgi:hypothetical protein
MKVINAAMRTRMHLNAVLGTLFLGGVSLNRDPSPTQARPKSQPTDLETDYN